jgi:hypothetical protein
MQTQNSTKLNKSEFVIVLADKTTDKTHGEQLSLCVWYVDKEGFKV